MTETKCNHQWSADGPMMDSAPPICGWKCSLCGEVGYSNDWRGTVKPITGSPYRAKVRND